MEQTRVRTDQGFANSSRPHIQAFLPGEFDVLPTLTPAFFGGQCAVTGHEAAGTVLREDAKTFSSNRLPVEPEAV